MKTYIPAPGRTVVLPGGQRWPEDGRFIDPLSPYETRLVRDGDLVEKPAPKTAGKPKETA